MTRPRLPIFGERLREARLARGWTQTDLGRRLRVSRSPISHYESGVWKNCSHARLVALCRALDVSADWLLGLTDVRPGWMGDGPNVTRYPMSLTMPWRCWEYPIASPFHGKYRKPPLA